MASYPSFPQLLGSVETPRDDLTVDRAVNGTAKARAFYTARKRQFQVRHLLTKAERDTLLAFYDANRLVSCLFTWTGDTTPTVYTCLFERPPELRHASPSIIEAIVRLVQV